MFKYRRRRGAPVVVASMSEADPDAIGPAAGWAALLRADGEFGLVLLRLRQPGIPVVLRSLTTQIAKAPATGFLALCAGASDAEVIQ